jgi:hypothetical protein
MSHPNDRREMLVSGHPGSKRHMGGRTNAQRRRDRIVRRKRTVAARSATVREKSNAEASA